MPMTLMVRCALIVLTCTLSVVAHAYAADPQRFDVPAGDLTTALEAFAKQSGAELVYQSEQVKGLHTKGVTGNITPEEAVTKLLEGTPLTVTKDTSGAMLITLPRSSALGTSQQTKAGDGEGVNDARGSGTSRVAQADNPSAGTGGGRGAPSEKGEVSEVTSSNEGQELPPPGETGKGILEILVLGSRVHNVDVKRSVNDPQPYYIFDSATIERSAALNVEDFLKYNLPMNAAAQTFSQIADRPNVVRGAASSINLRGLGENKTLVLINGRRMATPNADGQQLSPGDATQLDVNGIPLSAIERIEVLPTSASGIYGGNAMGGVVNVILKRNYRGAELRASNESTWEGNGYDRKVGLTYGRDFNDSRTQLNLNGSWSDAKLLHLEDRRDIFEGGLNRILDNDPSFIFSGFSPFLGATTNISTLNGAALVLDDGTNLSTSITHISPGTSPSTPAADFRQSLIDNAGSWNLALPDTAQDPTGLDRALGVTPAARSLIVSLDHEIGPRLSINLDAAYYHNFSSVWTDSGAFTGFPPLSASNPVNPFNNLIFVQVPFAGITRSYETTNDTQNITLGFHGELPHEWGIQGDYTWSRSKLESEFDQFDVLAFNADWGAGQFNPFVDTLAFPFSLDDYFMPARIEIDSRSDDFVLRGSGPLPSLPWGVPYLTLGLEHRIATSPESESGTRPNPNTGNQGNRTVFFERQQVIDSLYAEAQVPLVRQGRLPMLHLLELQIAGRGERFKVDTGTPGATTDFNTGVTTYLPPADNGEPFFAEETYTAKNGTLGLKYQPIPELTLRTSIAKGFLPPTPAQLLTEREPFFPFQFPVTDPQNGDALTFVDIISGGNADLKPQHSESWNAGVIWEPTWRPLKGLRLNLEYYSITQLDAIGSLDAQILVNNESLFPDRVIRDGDADPDIDVVNTSLLNLFKLESEGWDFTVGYQVETPLGTFAFNATQSKIRSLRNQYAVDTEAFDAVGFPSEGGAAESKAVANATWHFRGWSAGWSARYFSSYKQNGASGGPSSSQFADGGVIGSYVAAQGSETIPSQSYHDVFVGYDFTGGEEGRRSDWMLSGLTVRLGVKNLFNEEPPFDVFYPYYISPYGDIRLRSAWMSLIKSF